MKFVHEPGMDVKRVSVEGTDAALVTLQKLDHKIRPKDESVRPDIPLIRDLIGQRLKAADALQRLNKKEKLILVYSLNTDAEVLSAAITVLNAIGAAVAVRDSKVDNFTLVKGEFRGRKASSGSVIFSIEIK